MKGLAGVLAAGILLCGNSASAEQIDLSAWTCRKFQSASKDQLAVILAWLDGFYKDQDEPPVIDTDAFATNSKKLGEYCTAHPDDELITAADKLFKPGE